MEEVSRNSIAERTKGVVEHAEKQRWVNAVDAHFINGTTEYVGLYSENAYQEFAEMLGHAKITADKIIAYTYEATANEPLSVSRDGYKFKGQLSIPEIQNGIGDLGINLEFPNCFKTSLVVALDGETMVVYHFETISWGVVCEACTSSEDPDVQEELELNEDTGHGCGHVDDEYRFDYSAIITERTTAKKFFKQSRMF
jgi:hypothetical protein